MENTCAGDIARAAGGKLLRGDKDQIIKNVSIDSRSMNGQDLFVPLIGERTDAHDYIGQAMENGAVAVLTSRDMEPFGDAAWIKVNDTLQALKDIGTDYRRGLDIRVVGVTGSVGKTTTREMTAAALGAGYRVFKTHKNLNSNIGLPLTLTQISRADEIAVLEMGISDFGEMEELSYMAMPHTAIITNIGSAHLAAFGTRDNTFREKFRITQSMAPGGTIILNGDDEYLKTVGPECGLERIFFGLGPGCDITAADIEFTREGTEFTAVYGSERARVTLPVTGRHMVMNALAALAAARVHGIDMEAAAEALAGFKGFKNRQQILTLNGCTIIDDTYNASPDSMKAALTVLAGTDTAGSKAAVLADMLELGACEAELHREVGEFAAGLGLDALICVGGLAAHIAEGYSRQNGTGKVYSFATKQEALPAVRDYAKEGNALLFKGSNGMRMGELIKALSE